MTVRNGSDMQVYYNNGSTVGVQSTTASEYQHQIKITKVVGYKQNASPIVIPTIPTYYTHAITVYNNASLSAATARAILTIISSDATPFTIDTLATWLANRGYTTNNIGMYNASGAYYFNSASLAVMGVRAYQGRVELVVPRGAGVWETPQMAGVIDNVNQIV